MAEQDPLRIIVQNLSFEATTDELRAKFAPFGTIVDAIIAVEAGGRSRGFGFVTFDSPDAVTAIVAEGVVHELGGRVLRVQIANQKRGGGGGGGDRGDRKGPPREIKAEGPKLYCGDLPWELSADELAEHFGKFGKVVNAYLAEVQYAHSVNGYKPHRGFGFVEFATEEEATAALKAQHTIKGVAVRTTSAKGEPKGDKDKRRKERSDRPNNNNAGGESTEEGKSGKRRESGGNKERGGKEGGKEGGKDTPPKARTPPADKPGSKQGSPKPAAAAAPAAAPAKKTGGVKVAAAPKENPWSKKGGDAAGGDAAANAAEFPTLGDVASGKVKLRKKTEDEVAHEIAQERARESKDKKAVEGKGKEEAE